MVSEQAPFVQSETVDIEPVLILDTSAQIVRVNQAGAVTAARYAPVATITGAASPASRTVSIVNRGQSGAGSTVVATLAFTAGVNAAAFDEKDFTLSAVANATTVAAGDVLEVRSAPVGGTGLVDPGGTVTIEIGRG